MFNDDIRALTAKKYEILGELELAKAAILREMSTVDKCSLTRLREILDHYDTLEKSVIQKLNTLDIKINTFIANGETEYGKFSGDIAELETMLNNFKEEVKNTTIGNDELVEALKNKADIESVAYLERISVATPQMFGAVGDGETDDTEAFKTMFASGVNAVKIPVGVYLITEVITIPTNVKRIEGVDVSSSKIKLNGGGFCYAERTARINVHGLAIYGTNTETAFKGNVQASKFSDLRIYDVDTCFEFGYGTWTVSFISVEMTYANYGIKALCSAFNDIRFSHCYFQHLKSAVYNKEGGYNITFDCCDFELNEKCFDVSTLCLFRVQNSYIEGNENVLYLNRPNFDGDFVFENCWLYAGSATGGLCSIETNSSKDANPTSVIFERCRIVSEVAPVAFRGTGEYSLVGVSFVNNWYKHTVNSYTDLIDKSGCDKYFTVNNVLPITSDVPLFVHDKIKWYGEKSGNHRAAFRTDQNYHVYGYATIEQSGYTSIQIDIPSHLGVWPQSDTFGVVNVQYADDTITTNLAYVTTNKFIVANIDSTKTTKKVFVDVHYS